MYHNEKTDRAFPELRSQREIENDRRAIPEGLLLGTICAVVIIAIVGLLVMAGVTALVELLP